MQNSQQLNCLFSNAEQILSGNFSFQLLAICYLEWPVFVQRWPRIIDNTAVSSYVNLITAEQRLPYLLLQYFYNASLSWENVYASFTKISFKILCYHSFTQNICRVFQKNINFAVLCYCSVTQNIVRVYQKKISNFTVLGYHSFT